MIGTMSERQPHRSRRRAACTVAALAWYTVLMQGGVAAQEACEGGSYYPPAALQISGAAPPRSLVVTLDATGTTIVAVGGCQVVKNRFRRPMALVSCELPRPGGRPPKARRFTVRVKRQGCDGVQVRFLRLGRTVTRFLASRTGCGDGILDPARGESCETAVSCPGAQACTGACTCVGGGGPAPDNPDGDCLPDDLERRLGLDPQRSDTDGDTVSDGDEDLDNDGLSNCDELGRGTALDRPDTDGDGSNDGLEVSNGTSPIDPDDKVLALAERLVRDLTPVADTDTFAFVLPGVRRVFLRVTAVGGGPGYEPCLTLYDAAGNSRATWDACPTTDRPHMAAWDGQLEPGRYFVRVADSYANATGTYRLQILTTDPAAAPVLRVVPHGARVDAVLDTGVPGDMHLYQFELNARRRVKLAVGIPGAAGAFEPCLRVYLENGTSLSPWEDCAAPGTRLAQIDTHLETGRYYVAVTDGYDNAGGPYRLRHLPVETAAAEVALTTDAPVVASLDPDVPGDVRLYQLVLTERRRVTLQARRLGNVTGLEPCVRIYDTGGSTISPWRACASDAAPDLTSLAVTLEPGTYLVAVTDKNDNAGGAIEVTLGLL